MISTAAAKNLPVFINFCSVAFLLINSLYMLKINIDDTALIPDWMDVTTEKIKTPYTIPAPPAGISLSTT